MPDADPQVRQAHAQEQAQPASDAELQSQIDRYVDTHTVADLDEAVGRIRARVQQMPPCGCPMHRRALALQREGEHVW